MRYKAIVIGCGKIGSTYSTEAISPGVHSHAQAFSENPAIELVGMCDPDQDARLAAGSHWRVETDHDPISLCRRLRPEIVSLCTPNATHFPIAMDLLKNTPPRVLFIEKPMALTSYEAEEILQLANQVGCSIAINYSRRFDTKYRTIRDELRRGVHGRPLMGQVLYGKGLLHSGSHAIDLMRFWLGDPLSSQGVSSTWGPEGDPTWSFRMTFPAGGSDRALIAFEAFDERIATVWEISLFTEKTKICLRNGGDSWEFFELRGSPTHPGYKSYLKSERESKEPIFQSPSDSFERAVENIVNHLDKNEPLLCSGADGLAALRCVESVRNSP